MPGSEQSTCIVGDPFFWSISGFDSFNIAWAWSVVLRVEGRAQGNRKDVGVKLD